MPSVFLKTYGCQMNERDSEAVAAQLVVSGFSMAESEASADVVLLNTCSVRDSAEQKALGKMQYLTAALRRRRPEVVLGFLGCMAQARGEALLKQLPGVDLVIGTQKFHRTASYLNDLLSGKHAKVCDINEETGSQGTIKEHLTPDNGQAKPVTAYVSIMQGCNQLCAFCIVPHTRGRERSRSIDEILAECRDLASRGVREITLLGQIVTSYGRREIAEHNSKSPFVQLLEAVHEIDGLKRLRFTAPHPKGFGDDLIDAYGRLPKLCESAHMPLQSGSNRMLKLMHRGYTVERFLELIGKLRRVRPQIGITTDLIAGFPGETDADFEQTLELAKTAEFDSAFLFKYSPRQATPAASLPDQVPQLVKEERHAVLMKLIEEIAAKKYQRFIGQLVQVLVEGPSRKNSARLEGRTRCNKIVVFDGAERHRGQILDLKIVRAGKFTLYGDPAWINLD